MTVRTLKSSNRPTARKSSVGPSGWKPFAGPAGDPVERMASFAWLSLAATMALAVLVAAYGAI